MKSIFAVAFMAASVASAITCPANIPAITASITQMYNGGPSNYNWVISPTALSTITPQGVVTPCEAGYIAQYSTTGNCDAACNVAVGKPSTITGKCVYTVSDGGIRTMTLAIGCDESATALRMDNTVQVTDSNGGLLYAFTGAYSGVCGSGPGPAPGPDGGNGDSKSSPACGGGCAFVIVFFVGAAVYVAATVAFNFFKLGKRGKELAPHPEFWLLIPGLIKDGVLVSFNLVTSPCRKDGSGSATYASV